MVYRVRTTHPRRPLHRTMRTTITCVVAVALVWPATTPAPSHANSGAGSAAFTAPVAPATVVRGFVAPRHRYGPGHRGVDLAAPIGAPVLAPAPGVVAFTGQVAGRPVVAIDHPGGLRSSFEPVSSQAVAGSIVAAGAVIGAVSTAAPTAHCPMSCVHWGVRRNGDYIDPMSLLHRRVVLLPARSDVRRYGARRAPIRRTRAWRAIAIRLWCASGRSSTR